MNIFVRFIIEEVIDVVRQINLQAANQVDDLLKRHQVAHNVIGNADLRDFAYSFTRFHGTGIRCLSMIGTIAFCLIVAVMEGVVRLIPRFARAVGARLARIIRLEIVTLLHVIRIARHAQERNRGCFGINAHQHHKVRTLKMKLRLG